MRLMCRTCGGIYESIGADGLRYAHACPPVRALKVRRIDGSLIVVAPGAARVDDAVIEEVFLPRRAARNENPDLAVTRADGSHPMISAGGGVTPAKETPVPIDVPDAAP